MEYTRDTLEALTAAYGSPLYVFDEKGFSDNFKNLTQAMRSCYDRYQAAYSFKTNYTPYVCLAAKRLGAYAEAVSGMEYELARRIGFENENIIFNGPDKSEAGISALLNGCIVNADSLDELKTLCLAAEKTEGASARIGLRVNLDVGQGFVSRFGMDERDLAEAFRMTRAAGLRISGLHCHISRARGLGAWRERMEKMLALADRFFPDGPDFINLGSGMFGSMDPGFAAQFTDVPTYEQYAAATAGRMAEHYAGKRKPILFTEPGTTLVNRFFDCIARVQAVKEINGHCFAVLNCSVHNLGETCTLKRLPVTVAAGEGERKYYESIDLTGYTCLEQDVMLTGFSGMLGKGDLVVFGNVGGYSNVLKPPFIRPNCAMIAEKAEGGFELIKAAETYEDLLHTYRF